MDYIKRFDNGLRLVVKYLPGMLSVTTGVYAGVGSSDEELALNGISHFIEHMMFKGTKTRTAFEIADSVDSVGAQINAFTTKECTCYYTKSTADHFDFSMEILSDLLFESLFDPKEMEREKGVVLEEISMEEDTPDDLASARPYHSGQRGERQVLYQGQYPGLSRALVQSGQYGHLGGRLH